MRYLCNPYGGEGSIRDQCWRGVIDQARLAVEDLSRRSADLLALIRTPHANATCRRWQSTAVKLRQVWTLLDAELAHRPYVAGSTLSIPIWPWAIRRGCCTP